MLKRISSIFIFAGIMLALIGGTNIEAHAFAEENAGAVCPGELTSEYQADWERPTVGTCEHEIIDGVPSCASINSQSIAMVNYFKNLKENYPINVIGSCGYVALSMYLSYFDTYHNDNIIPEYYDVNSGNVENWSQAIANSPGVKRVNYDIISYNETLEDGTLVEKKRVIDKSDYDEDPNLLIDYARANFASNPNDESREYDFQMLLMHLDHDVSPMIEPTEYYQGSFTRYGGLLHWYEEYVLNSYGETVEMSEASFPGIMYYMRLEGFKTQEKQEDIENSIKEFLDEGVPVILCVESGGDNPSRHAVVAYYYDCQGIHMHFGWSGEETDVLLPYGGMQYYVAGYVVDFANMPHVHSDNYVINGVGYCGCGHRAVGHDYTYAHEAYDDTYHACYCSCGEFVLERHDDRASGYTVLDGAHVLHCVCGDIETEHNYEYKYYYSADKHRTLCRCGVEGMMEDHQYDIVSVGSEAGHILLCECGIDTYEYHAGDEGVEYYDEDYHEIDCDCGALAGHEYTHGYQDNGLTTHFATCACGAQTTEEHNLAYTYVDASFHRCDCLQCGHTHTQVHAIQAGGMNVCIGCKKVIRDPSGPGQVIHSVGQAQYVSANGSYVLPSGIIVLVDEDIEAYLAGTLTFYLNGAQAA